jgi:predicted nucleic acid-binding protein
VIVVRAPPSATSRPCGWVRYPHGPFRDRVWELRGQLTAYDATYLALAEALPDALLLVGDAGLAMRADSSLGPGRVVRAA